MARGGLMAGLSQLWDQLVDCICRPPRDEYVVRDLPGGASGSFAIGRYAAQRKDFQLTNKRGKQLEVSRFTLVPATAEVAQRPLPTVIYCHCNSGSRRDSEEAIYRLLPEGIAVVSLDFEGSGLSEGDHVTLGAHEVDDVQTVLEHLREQGLATTVGLWGRSMGAVTALLCSQRDPSIAGIVCDSPFSKLTELMVELVEEQRLPIPKYLMKLAIGFMRRSVRKRAGFDILEVAPIDKVGEAFVPALFGHADGDLFVLKHHSQALHEKYAGEKNFISFDGDHNSIRPSFFYTSVVIFFHNVLRIEASTLNPADYMPAKSRVNMTGVHARYEGPARSMDVSLQPAAAGLAAGTQAGDIRSRAGSPTNSEPNASGAAAYAQSQWWAGSDGSRDPSTAGLDDNDDSEVMQRVLAMSLREARAAQEAGQPGQGSRGGQPDPDRGGGEGGDGGGGGSSIADEASFSLLPCDDAAEAVMLERAISASLAASQEVIQGLLASPAQLLPQGGAAGDNGATFFVIDAPAAPSSAAPPTSGADAPRPALCGPYRAQEEAPPSPEAKAPGPMAHADSEPLTERVGAEEGAEASKSKSCGDLFDKPWPPPGASAEEEELERLRQRSAAIAWPEQPAGSDE
eukprot:jgi/Tetstr1/465918/TSEL_010532.t1